MSTLRAGDRPLHHYRAGRLRAEPALTRGEPPAQAQTGQEPVFAAPAPAPSVAAAPKSRPRASWAETVQTGASDAHEDEWDEAAASFVQASALHAAMTAARTAQAGPRPAAVYHAAAHAEGDPVPLRDQPAAEAPAEGWVFRHIRPEARAKAKAQLFREPPPVTRAPRDPAPSRLAYRMERLWLTPLFRVFMRVGVPILVVIAVAAIWLGDEGRRAAVGQRLADLRTQFENRPEFMVKLMSIDGASQPVADAVRQMLPVRLPASSFRIDLEAFRAAIEQVDAVGSASVKVGAGGVLNVVITERKPAVLWRTEASLEMLDATGHRVATLLDRSARPDLPVIAGIGAEDNVPEALSILAAAGPILPRVRGLVRQGERRWDLVLDRDQRLLLPEADPVRAVERAVALDAAEELFARDVTVFDLRMPDRPTLRMTENAVAEMQKLTESLTKVADQ